MKFNEVIDKIMPLVNSGDKNIPFIISGQSGEYEVDFLNLKPEKVSEYLASIKEKDPLAVEFTGADFSKGSFPYVYDKVLAARLWAEYDVDFDNETNSKKLEVLANFLEDNMSEFSHEITDYIAQYDKPLASLNKMLGFSLESENSDEYYDSDKADEAIDRIENKITEMIKFNEDLTEEKTSNKRNIEGYEEIICIKFAGIYTLLAENPKAEYPYLICNIKYDNPLGFEERYDGVATDNYIEAMREFVNRVDGLVTELETEQRESGLPLQTLTSAECTPNGLKEDLTGKVIIIKPEILAPEYRRAEKQLKIALSGFGCNPDSRGNAVYCKELYSGKESCFERYDILGVADIEKLPEWAKIKLAPKEKAIKTSPEKDIKPPKKQRAAETVKQMANGESEPGGFIQVYITNRKTAGDDKKGEWVLLPATADMLRETLKNIDAKNGIYHVSKINAVKNEINILLPTASGLDELNMLAHYLKDMQGWERNKLDVILMSGVSNVNSVAGLINLLEPDNFNGFNTIAVSNIEELGRYWAIQDINNIPEGMSYSEYGEQCQTDEKGVFIDNCYVYEKYSSDALYNGIVPEEFQITKSSVGDDTISKQQPKKKPATLEEKLNAAKEKVKNTEAQKDNNGDKPKKRNAQEVD